VGGTPEENGRFSGLKSYENVEFPIFTDGNAYLNTAGSFPDEKNFFQSNVDPEINISEEGQHVFLNFHFNEKMSRINTQTVNTKLFGKAKIPNQNY